MIDVPEQRNAATDDTPAALHCNRDKLRVTTARRIARVDRMGAGRHAPGTMAPPFNGGRSMVMGDAVPAQRNRMIRDIVLPRFAKCST
jgi:hypothetical protein